MLTTEQVLDIIRNSKSAAVQNCECRSHYKKCDYPLEVCLQLNHIADKLVDRGADRYVSIKAAARILKLGNIHGLVHLSIFMPDHELYSISKTII